MLRTFSYIDDVIFYITGPVGQNQVRHCLEEVRYVGGISWMSDTTVFG